MNYTTNQVRGYASSNPYIQAYLKRDAFDSHPLRDKLGRGFSVEYCPGRKLDANTWFGNMSHYYAHRDFEQRFPGLKKGLKTFSAYVEGLEYLVHVNFSIDGLCSLFVGACYYGDKSFRTLPFIDNERKYKYEGVLTIEAMQAFIEAQIEKHLYPEGFFRRVQMSRFMSKQDTKRAYKHWRENKRQTDFSDWDGLSKWLKRKCNVSLGWNISIEAALRFLKKHGPFSKPVILQRFDMDFLNDFDGCIEEAECLVMQELSANPDVYYI